MLSPSGRRVGPKLSHSMRSAMSWPGLGQGGFDIGRLGLKRLKARQGSLCLAQGRGILPGRARAGAPYGFVHVRDPPAALQLALALRGIGHVGADAGDLRREAGPGRAQGVALCFQLGHGRRFLLRQILPAALERGDCLGLQREGTRFDLVLATCLRSVAGHRKGQG